MMKVIIFIACLCAVLTRIAAVKPLMGGQRAHEKAKDEKKQKEPKSRKRSPKLHQVYLDYSEAPWFDHWLEYAEHYEEHFPKPIPGKRVKLLEIGVQSGGSSRMWRQYYGKV